LLERVEITIAMEEGMVMADAIGRDQHIDRVPDRPPGAAQAAIVPGRLDRRCPVRHGNQLELIQHRLDGARRLLVAYALQDLGDGDRRDAKPVAIEV
jgi:hypothetical protein